MALSTYNKKEDGVKMSVHVDDPLVIGPEGPIRVLFDWLGMRIAVEGLETFDSARGLKYLGSWIPGDNSCRIHRGDGLDDGRDARQDTHDARNPHTAPDRGRRETFGRSKTTSVSRSWQGKEDGEVPPWTRDIALELRPRKGPLRWAAPQTASSGAMVWF